jgi:hypothetical protein
MHHQELENVTFEFAQGEGGATRTVGIPGLIVKTDPRNNTGRTINSSIVTCCNSTRL